MSATELELSQAPDGETDEQEREAFLRSFGDLPNSDEADQVGLDIIIDRYLERIAEREAEIARNAEISARRVEMIKQWERDANVSLERECRWLQQQIEGFSRQYDFGKKKTRALPHGEFGNRWQPERIEIIDPVAAVAFAKANGLEIKESVNKTPLHDHVKKTGIIPDGVEVVPGWDKFFVKAGL